MPLKPHVAAILNAMAEAGRPGLHELSPPEARAGYQMMHAELTKVPLAAVEDTTADGVPIRIYRASEEMSPCIVFFHGGGWVIGDLETHDAPCRMLASQTGCTVIAVDYGLAPERPFPGPVDDCYKALCWIAANGATLNVDTNKLAVAGDSAGGNLATVMCLRARDENGPALRHQVLIYPVTDGAMDTPSYTENGEGYMLSRDTMIWFFDHYADAETRNKPEVSPLLADSVANLPPATIITAEFDPLRDEGEAYGKRLEAAGIDVALTRFDGQVHGFFTMTDMMPEAAEAVELIAARLARDLA